MTMTVNLGAPLEAFVEEAVAHGRYGSRSEVLREGVRLVQEREKRLERLLAPALAQMEAGEGYDLDAVFHELDAELAALIDAREGAEAP